MAPRHSEAPARPKVSGKFVCQINRTVKTQRHKVGFPRGFFQLALTFGSASSALEKSKNPTVGASEPQIHTSLILGHPIQ